MGGSFMKIVRSFTVTQQEIEMLEAVAQYHGFSKSSTITTLPYKEFWILFPHVPEPFPPQPGPTHACP